MCQKVQCTCLRFQFMSLSKHLQHSVCTQFPKLKFIRHNFVKQWHWNLREMQGKWCNGELSVFSNLLFKSTQQIFIHNRQTATPQIIMHIFASFIRQPHPSPYDWTTQGLFSIQDKSRRTSACFKKQITDRISWGRILYLVKYYKHNTMCKHRLNVWKLCLCLSTTQHACAPSWLQCCSGSFS